MQLTSQRIQQVQAPIIPEVADLIEANPGTISLGQGVVYYRPPQEICDGIREFSKTNSHSYAAVEGIPQLRRRIEQKIQDENGIDASRYCVVVSAGSNMGFLNAVLSICDPGDEVIVLKPWYFNHEMAIRIANCIPISISTDPNFQPDIDLIKAAIGAKTRAIVTVSPNNPTGVVYSSETLDAINQLCAEHEVFHIHDEAYEYFCYDGNIHYSPASREQAHNHTISLFSTSKSFGLANWRIGYAVIPKALLRPVRKIQDTNLICPAVISQYAAIECLKLGRAYGAPRIKRIESVRHHLDSALHSIDGLVHGPLQGAFYAFITLNGLQCSDFEAVKFLIEKHQVAVIPGSAFGIPNSKSLRVSYAALEPETAINGVGRLKKGLEDLLSRQTRRQARPQSR